MADTFNPLPTLRSLKFYTEGSVGVGTDLHNLHMTLGGGAGLLIGNTGVAAGVYGEADLFGPVGGDLGPHRSANSEGGLATATGLKASYVGGLVQPSVRAGFNFRSGQSVNRKTEVGAGVDFDLETMRLGLDVRVQPEDGQTRVSLKISTPIWW